MRIRVIILSFALLFGGCEPFTTTSILGTLGGVGMGVNKYVDYTLTRRSLDLKEREIELKEKQFRESRLAGEKVSELNERLDTVEDFMKYFPKQFKDLGDTNKSEI